MVCSGTWSMGQGAALPAYNCALIQDSLKRNANAVVREDMEEYSYFSPVLNKATYRMVITVLNKNGDKYAIFRRHYDKFNKITSFVGNIYDANGKLIRKIKSSEVIDIPGSVGYPQFDDIHIKYYEPLLSVYPYTVEYVYENEISGSYDFPRWMAFDGYNVSIEKTSLRLVVPADFEIHYKQLNLTEQPQVEDKGEFKSYLWSAENVMALDQEPGSDDMLHYAKTVYTAPSEFMLAGFHGKMNTWPDFAQWVAQLNAGRDVLSEAAASKIRELVRDIPDDRDKVKKLYSCLQQKTRYFNIALGIGGLQPMDANLVDEVGYGDCKGLSNYMKAMLKVVGIESYYTLVKSGSYFPQIVEDFPGNQFNHAMICVPLHGDTVWLECTSQNIPFGFLGDFTSDRKVLLIKDNGGELVRTPVYKLKDNFQYTSAKIDLAANGNATADISRKFGGLQFEDHMGALVASPDEQKKWLFEYFDIPNFKITGNEFRQANPDKPESVLHVKLQMDAYCSASGKRVFLPLNLINRSTYSPSRLKKRWSNFERNMSYIDCDSVEYMLPEGVSIEFLPENKETHSPFGTYISTVTFSGNSIKYYRHVEMFK
jgi:hypothetical protein